MANRGIVVERGLVALGLFFAGVVAVQRAITDAAGGLRARGATSKPAARPSSCPGGPRPAAGAKAPAGSGQGRRWIAG